MLTCIFLIGCCSALAFLFLFFLFLPKAETTTLKDALQSKHLCKVKKNWIHLNIISNKLAGIHRDRKACISLNTPQTTKYLWLEYNNCMGATRATLSLLTLCFFFASQLVTSGLCPCEVPQPKAPNYCQGLSVDIHTVCCEVQMKQMWCNRTKAISFPVTPFICLQLSGSPGRRNRI